MDIPIIIISFNNYKYVKNTLEQIKNINQDYYNNIIVMDNCSTCEDTINYLKFLNDLKIAVIFNKKNNGPWVTYNCNSDLYNKLPNKFIITDPDLGFNKNIPNNFIDILSELSDKYKCNKIGFALDIQDCDKMFQANNFHKTQYVWESKFWKSKINDSKYELYLADIDTTFCLINKSYNTNCIRIAGDFLAKHIPWYVENNIYNIYSINKIVYNDAVHSTIRNTLKQHSDDNYECVNKNKEVFYINKSQKNIDFFKNIFSSWEKDTFEIFDKFLDKNKTFIDIGAWIGATGMYASRMSKDIICLEADIDAFRELELNMKDNCEKNYKLINKPINIINYANSNSVETMTIKKIIEQSNIYYDNISLIKVNINGGEENILDDLYEIHKTYNIPLYISFHYDLWINKNLERFSYLNNKQRQQIKENPFVSLLFE